VSRVELSTEKERSGAHSTAYSSRADKRREEQRRGKQSIEEQDTVKEWSRAEKRSVEQRRYEHERAE
jgi:hypothetical protein